jgi:hypothetical protein
MLSLLKRAAQRLLVLSLLSVAACSTPQSTLPPQAPVVVRQAEIPPLSDLLKKQPLPSGAYLRRADERDAQTQESLRTLRPKSAP